MVSTHSRPKAAGYLKEWSAADLLVSTHSRPKAAGTTTACRRVSFDSFNTQPPEGGWTCQKPRALQTRAGFNTQPPEGGWPICTHAPSPRSGFNTQPPEGGWLFYYYRPIRLLVFQHTAARRRLDYVDKQCFSDVIVSTHSRPKAAGKLYA